MLRTTLKLACAFTVLMTIASTTLAGSSFGVNLLSNPNFEYDNSDGAWEGPYNRQTGPTPVSPDSGGSYYWSPWATTEDVVLYQTVDLTELDLDELRISSGGYYIEYGGLQNSRNGDQGMIAIAQKGDEIESTTDNLGWQIGDGTVDGWEWSKGVVRMAGGADTLVYQFCALRNSDGGLFTSAYLDNSYLRIQEYTVWGGEWTNSAKTQSTEGVYGAEYTSTDTTFYESSLTLGYSSADYGEFLCLACESAECDDANLKFRSDLIICEGCQFVCNGSMTLQANSTIDVRDSSLETKNFRATGYGGKVILDNSTWTSTDGLNFYTGSIHLTNGSTMTTEGDVEFCNGSSFSYDYKVKLTIDAGCEYHSQGETKMGVYARLMYVEVDGLLHNSGELLRLGSPYTGIRCFLNVNDGGEWRSDGPVSYIWGEVSINEGGTWTSNDEVQVGYFSDYEPADDVFAELNVDGGTWTANGPVTFGNPSGRNFGVQLTVSNEGTVTFNDEVVCDTRTHFILDGGDIFANAGLELTGSDDEDHACTITGYGDFYMPNSTLTMGENTRIEGNDTGNCRIRLRQGTLSGIGSLKNVVLKNIDVTPGDGIGTMAWDSVKMRDDARLIMELGGLEAGTEYDQLLVSGNWILNGTLEVIWYDGFKAECGDTFTIFALDDDITINGSFDEIILPELSDSDLEWDTSLLYTTGQLSVSMVPEPATIWLLLAGGVMIFLRRKQRAS